jgi:hypothetical protein
MTVSHRQSQLYAARGFDAQKWQNLIDDANALRKEIKLIANEYDVEWDETKDAVSETVHKALKAERRKNKEQDEDEDEKDEKDDKPKKHGNGDKKD